MNGYLALSPLIVFLLVYLVSSILAKDFYSVPIASAFLIASCYALGITRGGIEQKIAIFSEGAGNKNVLLMIWIFVLAGAFASTAKDIGAIDATVNLTLGILPGKLLYAGIFIASCFISMSIGTSVGTIVALVPVATGLAAQTGTSTAFMAAIVTGGAFFGDNLSFISDTTIAATKTQGCSMRDKFRANIFLAAPAAAIVTAIYVFQGSGADAATAAAPIEWTRLIPYLLVIIMALSGINVIAVLAIGIGVNAIIGFCSGMLTWSSWLSSIGNGIGGMGELIIVTMLAGGMLELIRSNGGIDFIIRMLTHRITGKRGAEFSIAALVGLANLCTANNTIAIITTGSIAKDITRKFRLDPRKTASILDTFSCLVQGILPYGAQLLMASGLAAVSTVEIIRYLYYPFALGTIAILAIIFRFPRKYS
ncbi:MAG: Na+/H+ antiporter NhaC family protein [Clostridium sp.]|nr:Na+/H+ antiporter NhaC family protein [Bacteroides sp.]MCM1198182.1 Na+/H+ antiporter NhaC family protein [Clostridium sp.]